MTIHRKDATDSTNIDARAGRPGDVFVAEFQRAGRGRLDHSWHSAKGENLMFSVVLACGDSPPAEVATLPLVVGLAVLDALRPHVPPSVRLAVKWPNDILADGRKIVGILCERHGDCVIAGVGVNVNERSFPAEIAARATSLAVLAGRNPRRRRRTRVRRRGPRGDLRWADAKRQRGSWKSSSRTTTSWSSPSPPE